MNSPISSQEQTTGPSSQSTSGLSTRKATIDSLYQRGVLPRKFWPRAAAGETGIGMSLLLSLFGGRREGASPVPVDQAFVPGFSRRDGNYMA
ncbi:hypothetical protein D3C77_687310 [compost metagenome]